MKISVIGVDLSKNIFHIVGINHRGSIVSKKKVRRPEFMSAMRIYEPGTVVCMEACQGAHFWSRRLRAEGYEARQIPAQVVKRYTGTQKNDFIDAQAIAEAGSRECTRFVPTKSVEQLELQALQGIRARLVSNRTALLNQARGYLAEHGVALAKGISPLKKYLCSEMEDITAVLKRIMKEFYRELSDLNEKILQIEKSLALISKTHSVMKRLLTIPAVGKMSAVALCVASGDPKEFKNGRQFAAHLGLVPRQHTTGGKTVLLGITKNGNRVLRSLLVLGAHSQIRQAVCRKLSDPHSLWIRKLYDKKGANLTAVALANKNARIAWRILTTPELEYQGSLAH